MENEEDWGIARLFGEFMLNEAAWLQPPEQAEGGNAAAFGPREGESKKDTVNGFISVTYRGGIHFNVQELYNEMTRVYRAVGGTVSRSTVYNAVRELRDKDFLCVNNDTVEIYKMHPTPTCFKHCITVAQPPSVIREIMISVGRRFIDGGQFTIYDVVKDGEEKYDDLSAADAMQVLIFHGLIEYVGTRRIGA